MFHNFFESMNVQMKPVLDLAEANKAALEKLANLQKETVANVLNASLEQCKSLSKCKDPQEVMDLQVRFYKSLDAKVTDTAEKSFATLTGAKDAFSATVEKSAKNISGQ